MPRAHECIKLLGLSNALSLAPEPWPRGEGLQISSRDVSTLLFPYLLPGLKGEESNSQPSVTSSSSSKDKNETNISCYCARE